ncbi:AcvB/VirJ family lysyl-phosphatidylglycerol hydrolase [Agrobacterium tumefaciens]|uniref:AcvB/VirJ family lysyl-phosphatidylglycerol hydrolase n=1 Tax=Agrobacterium tumefaciens TaxID=358 RepID=UPI0007133191|nr:hypothetical protein ASD74_20160 [Rhizobium sp. Root564]NTC84144.1 virulence factor family protein [Agrobacterium tumefaciens]NTD11669.1 virulence factor family protein [Agrobacterium tumefaciens]
MKILAAILTVLVITAGMIHLLSEPDLSTQALPTSRILYPPGQATGVVVLLSDLTGWSEREEAAANALTQAGAITVGVDLPEYYAALERIKDECLYLVSDIENVSRQLQRSAGISSYYPPIVGGVGDGATLALAIAAQTPDSTIAETLAVDPGASIPLSTVLCTPAPKANLPRGMVYGLTEGDLPNPIRVVFSPFGSQSGRSHVDELRRTHPGISVREVGIDSDTLTQNLKASFEKQISAATPLNLPIVIIETKPLNNMMAIIVSGDGGWRDIDQKLGDYMKDEGVPVIGLDALRYFWSEKTPTEAARDLSRILNYFRTRWRVDNVLLIGYSFGANVLPATYRNLSEADKNAVSLISLLAPSREADFQIAVSGWLGFTGNGKYGDPTDALADVEPAKIQCIYGVNEEDSSACPKLRSRPQAHVVGRQGGHKFDGDYRALNRLILDRAKWLHERRYRS